MIFLLSLAFANPLSNALQRGDCAGALAINPEPAENHFRLAIGRCLHMKGDINAAIQTYDTIMGEFQDYAALLKAESALLHKKYELALNSLEIAPEGNYSDFLRAQALLGVDQHQEARVILNKLLTTKRGAPGYLPDNTEVDPAHIRWLLADAAVRRGAVSKAKPVLWNIWTNNPTSPYAERAALKLIGLGERVPNGTTETGRAYITKRADTLRKLHMHKEAQELYELLPVGTRSNAQKSLDAFRARDYPRAIELYQNLPNKGGESLFNLALSYSRVGDYDNAAKTYTTLFKTYPKHKRAPLASFKVPYLSFDKRNYSQAIPLFQEHMARYRKYSAQAQWFLAWSHYKTGDNDSALEAIETLLKNYGSTQYAPYALYWKGKLYEGAGKDPKAIYQQLLRDFPTNGQAWFAARKHKQTFPPAAPLKVPPPPAVIDVPSFHEGRKLAAAGFDYWGRTKLRPLKKKARSSKTAALVLAHALIEAGDFQSAMRLAKPYCKKPWREASPLAQQACYPRPFGDAIAEQLQGSPIPALLPYAIMKAESNLKPWVRSIAGARGLMQLMPFVGERLHMQYYPSAPYDPDLLFLAGYNARLGTAELQALHKRFEKLSVDHTLPLIIAGYNGGPEAVERWMKLYDKPIASEEFAEDVGYTETRKYVKRVLGYLMEYRYIYGE